MKEVIKLQCTLCGKEYEVDMAKQKPRDLMTRYCPECKDKRNPSGANKPTINKG